MNKKQFISYIAENFECAEETAENVINVFAESLYLAVSEGYNINIDNLGTFKAAIIPSRRITIPKSSKKVTLQEYKRLYFKPSQDLKRACY